MARDYKKEQTYDSKPVVKKKRANRNLARRIMERKGLVKKGDGKDVHHKNGNPRDNRTGNLAVTSKTANRSFKRTRNAKKVIRRV